MHASDIKGLGFDFWISSEYCFPTMKRWWPNNWITITNRGHLDWALQSFSGHCSAPAIVGNWEVSPQAEILFVSQKNQKVHWTYTLFWNSILWWIFESPTYYSLNMYYVPALAECYLKYFQYYFKYFQVSHCYNWDTREKLCFIWAHGFEVHSSWLGNLNGLACDNSSGWWDVYSGRITGQARVCKARAARLAQDYITNPLVRTTFWGYALSGTSFYVHCQTS